jgi:hypothetical protein
MQTQVLDVQIIRKLKRSQMEELKNKMIIFAEVTNLVEEPVILKENQVIDDFTNEYCT